MADEKKKAEMPFDPANMIENAFLMGIGVLEMTREKAQEFSADLIEKGKMSQSEAKKVADKLGNIAEEQQQNLRKTVAEETAKAVKATGGVTRADYDALKAELDEIKSLLKAAKSGAEDTAS